MLPDSATAASVAFLARGGPTYVASERAAQANHPRARSRRERHVNVDGSVLSRESGDPGYPIVVAPAHRVQGLVRLQHGKDYIEKLVVVDGLLLHVRQPRSLGISAAAAC
jgi:hypothetical protein